MKTFKFLPVLLLFVFASCSSVRVAADYDKNADFASYNTFAYYKPGVDKTKISDLDKRRILRAIDNELTAKGMVKSESPDLLVSIFTKERERVDVYNRAYGFGWGWNPYWFGNGFNTGVHTTQEGTLYIDLIDASTNELVWQGIGSANLTPYDVEKKEARIREIVREILAKYPPTLSTE